MDFDSIQEFVEAFSKLPSIGPRQATRLAFYLVNSGAHRIKYLCSALSGLENIKICTQCFFTRSATPSELRERSKERGGESWSSIGGADTLPSKTTPLPSDKSRRDGFTHQNQNTLCHICSDPSRNNGMLAVTEKVTDIISLEQARLFDGRYFVIGEFQRNGLLTPVHKARLALLKEQAGARGKFKEIILALSPTSYGNINASLLAEELKPYTEKITRLGRGIPTGGEIEFADDETLKEALRHRG